MAMVRNAPLTMSINDERLRWFRRHCQANGIHMSRLLDKWVQAYQQSVEKPLGDAVYRCKCGHYASELELLRSMFCCAKCRGVGTMKKTGVKDDDEATDFDDVLSAKRS